MKALVTEFIGTFFLVLTVALAGNPFAIGAVLTAMVYMGGYVSGAHYNPAVTAAALITKKINSTTAYQYWIVQFAAGIAAAAIFLLLKSSNFVPAAPEGIDFASAFLAEVIFTFALVSVVLHTGATKETKGNDYFGLAIGSIVMAGAFAVGPVSGAAFNPAVGVAPLLFDIAKVGNYFGNISLYLFGPLVGALLASWVYQQKN